MTERGYFAVDRAVFDHPVFQPEPFTEREAWIWMIGEASWDARRVRRGNSVINLARGEFAHSIRFMAKAWKWDTARVHRFLKRLKTDTMITTQATRDATHVTICNYNKYQSPRNASETQGETRSETRVKHQRNKLEPLNHLTNNQKEDVTSLRDDPPPVEPSSPSETKPDEIEAVAIYNSVAKQGGWPRVEKLTPARRRALRARLSENGGIDGFRAMLARAGGSDFLTGKIPRGSGHDNWMPNFDWFVNPRNFLKILEGSYDNRSANSQTRKPNGASDGIRAGMAAALARRPDSRLFASDDPRQYGADTGPAEVHRIGNRTAASG